MFVILVCLFVLYLSLSYWRRRKLPPGPWGLPIVGYLPFLDAKAPHVSLANLTKKYGPMYGLRLGGVYTVVLSDHKLVRKILAKEVATGRAPLYLTHGIMKGYGLICSEGDLWKDQRKFVINTLKNFGLVKFGPKTNEIESQIIKEVIEFIEDIKRQVDPKTQTATLDPLKPLRHNLGSVICQLVFGKSWAKEDKLWKWLQELQEEGTKHIGVAGPLNFFPFLRFLPKYHKTMKYLLDGKYKTHEVYQKIIEEPNSDKNNILQAFLTEREANPEKHQFYCDQQFYHLLADLFGAGLDTTLTSLRWYLLFMAANSEIQIKIQEELDNVLQGHVPTLENLPSLPLTEASIAETQRIRSVVPIGIPHGSLDEMDIAGYEIPKGTMIVPLQWAIHMNPATWRDPEKFDPGRFLDEEGRFAKPEAFIPFQTGKRSCVGDELARMLLFLFGATIIHKFDVRCDSVDLEGECGITLTPKEHKLTFRDRN